MPVRTEVATAPVITSSWSTAPTYGDWSSTNTIEWAKALRPRQSYCTAIKGVRNLPGLSRERVNYSFDGTSLTEILRERQFANTGSATLNETFPFDENRVDSAKLGAYDAVLNPAAKALVDVPLFIYELHDIPRGVFQSLRTLKRINEKVKSVDVSLATLGFGLPGDRRVLKFANPRAKYGTVYKKYTREQAKAELLSIPSWSLGELTGNVLLARLGILPTVSDCKGLFALYKKVSGSYLNVPKRFEKGTVFRASYELDSLPKLPPSSTAWSTWNYLYPGWTTGALVPTTILGSWKRVSGVISGRLLKSFEVTNYEQFKQMTRFNQGPLTFAWETTKFSWLFDYFVHIGRALAEVERHQAAVRRGLEFDDGVWCSECIRTGTATSLAYPVVDSYLDPQYPAPNTLLRFRWRTEYAGWEIVEQTKRFTRRPMAASDVLGLLHVNHVKMTSVHLGTIASLFYQLWGKRH